MKSAKLLRRIFVGASVCFVVALISWREGKYSKNLPRAVVASGFVPYGLQNSFEQPRAELRESAPREQELFPAAKAENLERVLATVHLKLQRWFATHTGESERPDSLMKELSSLLTNENVGAILQALSPEELATPFGKVALERWLKIDPFAAAQWVGARGDATESQALVVARNLANDPVSLSLFCDGLPASPWKESFLSGAGLEVISRDPLEAISLADRMSPGAAKINLLQTVAYDWTGRDPDATLQWIVSLNDVSLREQLIAVGAKAIAVGDPDLAVSWLLSAVKSETVLTDTALSIAEIWTAQDPAKAANWVSTFPQQGLRETAIERVARQWMLIDSVAADGWIQTLPERAWLFPKLKADQAVRVKDPGDGE